MKRLVGSGLVVGVGALLAATACTDDSSGTPDTGDEDVVDTSGVVDETPDESAAPDEPDGPVGYPPGPYGLLAGDRIEDLHFLSVDGAVLAFSQVYQDTSVKLLWLDVAAGWCPVCAIEAAALPGIWTEYNPQGLQILSVLYEDTSYNPATAAYAGSYARRYRWPFLAGADQAFVTSRYFDRAATPMNMFIDLTDMTIVQIEMGWDEARMRRIVADRLAEIPDRE